MEWKTVLHKMQFYTIAFCSRHSSMIVMVFNNEAEGAPCHKCLGSYLEWVNTVLRFPFVTQLPRKTFGLLLVQFLGLQPHCRDPVSFHLPWNDQSPTEGISCSIQNWNFAFVHLFRIWENKKKTSGTFIKQNMKEKHALLLSKGAVGITISLFPWVVRISFTRSSVSQNRLDLPPCPLGKEQNGVGDFTRFVSFHTEIWPEGGGWIYVNLDVWEQKNNRLHCLIVGGLCCLVILTYLTAVASLIGLVSKTVPRPKLFSALCIQCVCVHLCPFPSFPILSTSDDLLCRNN